jgi:DNA-binding response OmpR family regulator
MNRKVKILILDDEQIVIESVVRILKDRGFHVTGAQKAAEALALLRADDFDVLVTDLKMPGADGISVMREALAHAPQLSVLMITGYPTIETAIEAMKLGAVDYVRKPFSPDEFLTAIEKAVRIAQHKKDRQSREAGYAEFLKAVSSTLNLRDLLDLTVERSTRIFDVKGCALSLLDQRTQELRVLASNGLSREYLQKGRLDFSKSISVPVHESAPVLIGDATTDPRVQYPKEAEKEGIKSILSAPLKAHERVIGALRLYTSDARTFSDEEIALFSRVMGQTANALENARRFNDVQDEYDSLRDDLWEHFDRAGWE